MKFNSAFISACDSVHAENALKESAEAFVRAERERRRRKWIFCNFRPAAVMVCTVFVFLSVFAFGMYFQPVSVISVDINPSIELGVNRFERVIRVDEFNEDGRELADQLQLCFLDYEEAVARIIGSETVSALLNQEEELNIAVVGEDEERNQKLCENLEVYTKDQGNGHCYTASLESVKDAHHCGLSYGKYMAYQKVLQQDGDITVEEIRNMTMKEIRALLEKNHKTDHAHHEKKGEQHSETEEPASGKSHQHQGHNGKKNQKGHH